MPYIEIEAHELRNHIDARAAVKVTDEHPGSIPFTVLDAQPALIDDVESMVVVAFTLAGTLRLTMTASTIVQVLVAAAGADEDLTVAVDRALRSIR